MFRITRLLLIVTIVMFGSRAWSQSVMETTDNCTSVLVTKTVSTDGSVMTTHSVDGNYEFRIHLVPGKKFEKGAMRPVYKGGGRGREASQARIVGEIPEVEQTFTRYDASYSFMNEKQVGIGETTIGGKRELFNDEGIFDIMALERVALERASTAREAIKVMGELAEEYGYSDNGECLTVIDPNEAWIFEIFGPGPFEIGATWAARRIPEGEIGVSANRSRITTLDIENPDYYMASKNVYTLAEEMGWWESDSGEEFVFNKAYANPPSLYNTRREWRAFSILAPSLNLDPWSLDIPFSVKPDKKVSQKDLFKIHRDYYQGTEFDMSKGLAAGPFGSPNRWATRTRAPQGTIGWERSISIFRCSYCIVLQCRDWLPDWIGGLVWFAEDDPKTSCFVPLYCGISKLPESFEIGGRDKIERESAWWAFNFIANWADLKFSYMIEDIKKVYTTYEDQFVNLQPIIEKRALELYNEKPELAREYLTDYSCTMAQRTVDEWWKLSDYLIAKYSDGYINLPRTGVTVGYPEDWLESVGYGKTLIKK
ncbi:dipeptidase [candidate division KSB1 bacterium]